MKHRFFLLLLIPIILLSACGEETTEFESPVNFYYVQNEIQFGTDSGVIYKTVREGKGHREDYQYLLTQYLNGPTSYDCISPFPAGTTLEELSWDQSRVQIVLSPHITTLSSVDLMIACACLTRTAAEITGIDTIQIRSSSGLLNGQQTLNLTADSFAYWDQASASDVFN